MKNRPIGIFDSGVGGLTVYKEICNILPRESTIYFGDCGRTPYGTKSKETVNRYVKHAIRFLKSKHVKMIVVACNTASAYAIEAIRQEASGIPVIEVIDPGAEKAILSTKNKKIGVIATNATASSAIYEKVMQEKDPNVQVFTKACPLFVPIAEEGWWESDVALLAAKRYLHEVQDREIDTLLLGCTHYPLLTDVIANVMGSDVQIINSAKEVAFAVRVQMTDAEESVVKEKQKERSDCFYTSDSAEKFRELGERFLRRPLEHVEKLDVERFED